MIDLLDVSKSYGSTQVLKNVSTTFNSGKVYGIVGVNGAGKTTLFRCITGLEKYEGKVQSNVEILKNELGFLPTNPFLFNRITGREYVRLLCNARQVHDLHIDEQNVFDLPLDRYASTYSTGMKKKLALTAILSQNNSHYILDEPFNGVDIQSNMLIKEIVIKLKSLGRTILISSHIFSTLKDTCDEILLLKEGALEQGVDPSRFDELERQMLGNKLDEKLKRLRLF